MNQTTKIVLISAVIAALAFPITTASAASFPAKKFSNCAALNRVYPGGVAKSRSVQNRGGSTHYTPSVSSTVYNQNKSKDRDHDGIACER